MAIDQDQINRLLDVTSRSDSSDRVFFVDDGNLMTAITWFGRITGTQLSREDLHGRKATGGFFLHTHNDAIGGTAVNVTLRGGSSSSITTDRKVHIFTQDHQLLEEIDTSDTTPGCPTIDITNPGALGRVPRVVTCDGRIEIKFTTRFAYESNR